MLPFAGFPPGKPRTIALPAQFFSDLLPLINDLAEMKVTLFAFYAIQQREGKYRYVRLQDFLAHPLLIASLSDIHPDQDGLAALRAALDGACSRGTLLRADVSLSGEMETIFFINAEPGRTAVRQIEQGKWQHGERGHTVELVPERPNI